MIVKRLVNGEYEDIELSEATTVTVDPVAKDAVIQARAYLISTDFKALNGTLTPEQERLRTKAKQLLEGSFVEPSSDLFDV